MLQKYYRDARDVILGCLQTAVSINAIKILSAYEAENLNKTRRLKKEEETAQFMRNHSIQPLNPTKVLCCP